MKLSEINKRPDKYYFDIDCIDTLLDKDTVAIFENSR